MSSTYVSLFSLEVKRLLKLWRCRADCCTCRRCSRTSSARSALLSVRTSEGTAGDDDDGSVDADADDDKVDGGLSFSFLPLSARCFCLGCVM